MGDIIDRRPAIGEVGFQPHDVWRTRRLVVAIVALGVFLGGVGGWSAFAMFEPAGADEPSLSAEQAKWEADAEEACEHAVTEARRLDVERRRWEAQADHYAPGWRERRPSRSEE